MNQKTLYKLSGILSILAGILYILIQFIHPDETLEMLNRSQFLNVGILTMVMAIFSIIGLLTTSQRDKVIRTHWFNSF